MGLREQNSEERRQRILDCARRMLAVEGSFDMRSLASQARVSVATLYNLFGNKDDIHLAIVRQGIASLAPLLEAERDQEPLIALEQLMQRPVEYLVQHAAVFRPILRLGYFEPERRGRPEVVALYAALVGVVEGILRSAREAGYLEASLPSQLLAAEVFYCYRSAIEDWACREIDDEALARRVQIGVGLVLFALARGAAKQRLACRIEQLGAPSLADLQARFFQSSERSLSA